MFNRMKVAIANAVGGLDNSDKPTAHVAGSSLPPKFPYSRPHFLNLNIEEEVPLSADHRVRPIIVPRERDALPWSAGYAECVNSGKSSKNEDQAVVYQFQIGPRINDGSTGPFPAEQKIDVTYFGLFDGHAGFGAAVCAARQLHYIVEEKLLDVYPEWWAILVHDIQTLAGRRFLKELLIIGALEKAFSEMDQLIAEDRDKYLAAGGCTAMVILCILGKMFIANAGDSRAVHCLAPRHAPMSFDFTPESEIVRIRRLGAQKPELLGGEYTVNEYEREPKFMDLGKQILYRDAFMTGYAMKTITMEDLRMPIVSGEGKRSRVMNTIGVTRGFGDHDLRAISSKIPIKPFLSSRPEVNILDIAVGDKPEDEVLIVASDGLWDVTSNEKAAEIVDRILTQFSNEKHKYISAAQALVAYARGKPVGESSWRTSEGTPATGDDVSVFVIPLHPQREIYLTFCDTLVQYESDENVPADDDIIRKC
ncbi:uncharacterized protein CBL_14040 [Carabus blaptoides fortunei]